MFFILLQSEGANGALQWSVKELLLISLEFNTEEEMQPIDVLVKSADADTDLDINQSHVHCCSPFS